MLILAYPGEGNTKMGEIISIDYVIYAPGDPELQLKITERQPANLAAALRHAVRIEAITKAVNESHLQVNQHLHLRRKSS